MFVKVKTLDHYWYDNNLVSGLLRPLSWLYRTVVWLRRLGFSTGYLKTQRSNVLVIVVGNITVGGTGKTPLVIWLCQQLKLAGFQPGIVSRGYGGNSKSWPLLVNCDSNPAIVGDEAVLLARRCQCPMVVGPNRAAAVRRVLQANCNLVIADDGLQHYAMERNIEICVIDGQRRFGNGLCLPAGPLREPISRLQSVDLVIANGSAQAHEYVMHINVGMLVNVSCQEKVAPLADFQGQTVHAIAGIGNPQRFFMLLRQYGLQVLEHPFQDHHKFSSSDLQFNDAFAIIMTEKDAVKCTEFVSEKSWFLLINVEPEVQFKLNVLALVKERING